ncbi:MAG: alpha/beta hydrolase [Woeseiaceae bacterium]
MGTADDYSLGPDSMPQDGVPTGTVTKHTFAASEIYPGTETDYWVYVPEQYSDDQPACVMVFQDGEAYVELGGEVRAPTVMDNLIHKGEMPVTIGVFINPSKKENPWDQRETQYVPINDTYARFVLEEVLPLVEKDYTLVDETSGRAIAGMSDGGLVSFTVGWHRPDAFSKVISHIGSYTRLKGGSEYPYLIRQTRGNPKPIRVFLQDGMNDLNIFEGNWTLANISMESALMFARYDYRFEMGSGGHTLQHGGAIFPDTLRWIWRDYPGVKEKPVDMDTVTGEWDVVTNVYGYVVESKLAITADDGVLSATLHDATDGELEVTSISFEDNILIVEHTTPPSHFKWISKEGQEGPGTMTAWLKLRSDTLTGALSGGSPSDFEYDFRVTGTRVASSTE